MKKLILFILFVNGLLFAMGQKVDPAYASMLKEMYAHTVPFISPEELAKNSEKVYLLDTRSVAEYNTSHINGARFVNYDFFNIKKVEDISKDATIVVYCSVGWRSERIGERLQKNGYTNIYNLYGGMFQWYNEGYPVVNEKGETNDIHTYNTEWGRWVNKR